ncbi:hypothetical protein FUA26_05890 [Seonamhaeicola algicola]|uniref:Uncharacterized protein n=1 Tax=Seonamhaeicola algicola TaxID=1719036 RepID=A0A5C7ATF6_9FLAO|nr:hypothetical protein [Seonamhaeicola algicola]TXE11597.1 hypothetical protein FUA26_05890 [Seonamhaeicola algicola]
MFLKGVDGEDIFPILFFYPFYYIFLFLILNNYKKYKFVPVDAFQDLAKFIIAIKGDVHKNLINLRIDYSPIEHENNLLDPTKIGLVTRKGTSYKPYKVERYNAQFTMKDGTVCTTSLNQISIKVKTTKRRSSGKIKTKYKHKHKFFYALTLKLNPANYDIINAHEAIKLSNNKYQVAVTTINNAHFVKLKYKSKPSAIASVLRPQLKHSKSAVTEMLTYLTNNKVMIQQQLK